MDGDNDKKLKDIDRRIVRISLLEAPGTLMLGLGLYAKFGARGNAFHPVLNNPDVIQFLIVVGALIVLWGTTRVIALTLRKKKLMENPRP